MQKMGIGAGSSGGSSGPGPLGSYVVRPGDTLAGDRRPQRRDARRGGVHERPRSEEAAADRHGAQAADRREHVSSGPAPSQREVPNAPPLPDPRAGERGQIGQIAAAHGVPASLAEAIAWQESGFNNNLVSDANARGVMQILPGTWSWINSNLALSPLNASSAQDNVHAGVLYLGQLLHDTGGNIRETVAAYYQGLSSVRQEGMLRSTRQYVRDVLALRSRFGGS